MELMVIMPRDIEPSCLFTISCILSVKINAGIHFFGGIFPRNVAFKKLLCQHEVEKRYPPSILRML